MENLSPVWPFLILAAVVSLVRRDSPLIPVDSSATTNVKCSNTPSDAAEINTAIASSDIGDKIVIDGPCLINEVIKLLGNRTYHGESRTGTVLKQADDANLAAILASDTYLENTDYTGSPVAVRHVTLNGNKENNADSITGIIMRSWLSTVEDVHIEHMGGHGIMLTNASADGTLLTSTQVNGRIVGNFIEDSGGHGIFVRDAGNAVTDWNLMDNWIAGSGLSGIYMENAAGWVIERNHIYGVPHDAIYANRVFGTSISDNYIEGFGETSEDGTWYGIDATVQGGFASTISHNRVFGDEENPGSTYRYIALSRVRYGSGVVSVTGNAVRGAGKERGTGLYYDGRGNPLTVTSTGNAVVNVHRKIRIGPDVTVTRGVETFNDKTR